MPTLDAPALVARAAAEAVLVAEVLVALTLRFAVAAVVLAAVVLVFAAFWALDLAEVVELLADFEV